MSGSWVGRFTTHEMYSGGCMKDLDLKRYVIMNEVNRNLVVEQLERDTDFLERNHIMDYSLLLGIYYMTIECHSNDEDVGMETEEDEQKYGANDDMIKKASNGQMYANLKSSKHIQLKMENYLGGVRAQIIEGIKCVLCVHMYLISI